MCVCVCVCVCVCAHVYVHACIVHFWEILPRVQSFEGLRVLKSLGNLWPWGAWWLSGLSIQLLISAQVMISWFVSWSPVSDSALTMQSLLGIFCLLLSLPLPHSHSLSLKINKLKKDLTQIKK